MTMLSLAITARAPRGLSSFATLVSSDVVQHFFTTQLSGYLQFSHIRLVLIWAHIAQI